MIRNLKMLLRERQMTQKDLSADTGISLATIRLYASGKGNPTFRIVREICKVLACNIDDLMGQQTYVHSSPLTGGTSPDKAENQGREFERSGSDQLTVTTEEDLFVIAAYRKLSATARQTVDALLFQAVKSSDRIDVVTTSARQSQPPPVTFVEGDPIFDKLRSILPSSSSSNEWARLLEAVHIAIDEQLTSLERRLLTLHYYQGSATEDIAKSESRTPSEVEKLIESAVSKLGNAVLKEI